MIRRSSCSRGSLTVYSRIAIETPGRLRQAAARQGSAREAWEYLACRVVSRIFISEGYHIATITTFYLSVQRSRQHVQSLDYSRGLPARGQLWLKSHPAVEDVQRQQFGLPFPVVEPQADQGSAICRPALAGKGEVAQAVKDDTRFVALNPPQHMGMVADDHICAGINGLVGNCTLIGLDVTPAFRAPVEADDDVIGSQSCPTDILDEVIFKTGGCTGPASARKEFGRLGQRVPQKGDFFPLNRVECHLTGRGKVFPGSDPGDTGPFQVLQCFHKCRSTKVHGVVIGKRYQIDAGFPEGLGQLGVGPKAELFAG